MLAETIQLEKLRQKIEDVEYESGSQSDYLDRGKPNAKQAKQAEEWIKKLNEQSRALKVELKELLASVRAQQPQAVEEWIGFHTRILQNILEEKETDRTATTRRFVAKNTLAEWEKVRAGEQDYVSINWHFLKDYKERVRKFDSKAMVEDKPKNNGKAWWQFWK